jgi:hypothetical protein
MNINPLTLRCHFDAIVPHRQRCALRGECLLSTAHCLRPQSPCVCVCVCVCRSVLSAPLPLSKQNNKNNNGNGNK